MRERILYGIVILATAAFFAIVGHDVFSGVNTTTRHACNAPCVVNLPPNTQEDQFAFNYGWKGDTPILDVYRGQMPADPLQGAMRRDDARVVFCAMHSSDAFSMIDCFRNA